jgi:hypothetical protein
MARKAKPSKEPTSSAVQDWIEQREAQSKPADSAPPPPGPAPGPIGPPAPISAPPRPAPQVRTDARLEVASTGKVVAVICALVLVGGGVFGVMKFMGNKATATPSLGKTEIDQLRQGMTPEQAQAILGKPQSSHDGLRGARESKLDQAMSISSIEVYRKGTLLLAYDKDKKLIEVALGETPDEYYQRKEKKVKAVWEDYAESGFIHQDVWRPNTQPGI